MDLGEIVQIGTPLLVAITGALAIFFQRKTKRQNRAEVETQEETADKISAETAQIINQGLYDQINRMGTIASGLLKDKIGLQAWIDILEGWIRNVKYRHPELDLVTPMEIRDKQEGNRPDG